MKLFPCIFHLLQIILVYSNIYSLPATSFTTDSDRIALLAFKDQIHNDPLGALNLWNNNSLHYCEWNGVTCSRRHRHRVISLILENKKLGGKLSPHIGNLSFLRTMRLTMNNFYGPIPQQVGRLFRLQHLNLDNNTFSGQIPTNLSHCSNLLGINLIDNKLTGGIPVELTSLPKLLVLDLGSNELKGNIPPSLGNLSSLLELSLLNSLLTANIPEDLCHIRRLEFLNLQKNNLRGMVPSCLHNLTNLEVFSLAQNQLNGNLPLDIGLTLPNLLEIYMGDNKFTGPIPLSIVNASKLEILSFYENQFTGQVPRYLGRLHGIQYMEFHKNNLGSTSGDDLSFITSLTNCSSLQYLSFRENSLEGTLPNPISNLSTEITTLILGENQIYGSIPLGIGNLINLGYLDFTDNHLTGQIPEIMLMLPKLQKLFLGQNQFSGEIPDCFVKSSPLMELDLSGNKFSRRIPPSLRNCRYLEGLYLHDNDLNGEVPKQVFDLTLLFKLNLFNNSLTGSLAPEVGNLTNLVDFDISSNRMSGEIPITLGNCLSLEWLGMANNFFNGPIPDSLNTLHGIQYLNISHNNLSGEIPKYLANLTSLTYLGLSFNELEGSVPRTGVFENTSVVSLEGNSKLCGGVVGLNLKLCQIQTSRNKGKSLITRVVIPVVIVSSLSLSISCLLFTCYRKRMSKNKLLPQFLPNRQHTRISYGELLKATDSFSADNLIGSGSYGNVYKGTIGLDNTVVAVKVLNLQHRGASKSFLSECNALKNIRHRNLLKIITCCSTVDFHGNDFKALIFEFMAKGSLEEWLHPNRHGHNEFPNLNFLQKLNIAIEIASALDYLHNHCKPGVVHCNLKPSNVLFDDDMTAHLGDFGLAKIFCSATSNVSSHSEISSLTIEGSIGYASPEYGTGGEVSRRGDVYSYGILLLEMVTGKRPTDDIFQDTQNLHNFAATALPENVMTIVDKTMLFEESHEVIHNNNQHDEHVVMHDCLVSTIRLGIACSKESPVERMNIGEAIIQLQHVKDHYHGSTIHLE